MFYPYQVIQENDSFICVVPDLKVYVSAKTAEEAETLMKDNLMKNIEINFRQANLPIPSPSKPVKGRDRLFYVPLRDEARILLWNILKEKRLSVAEFGRILGVSRQQAHHIVSGSNAVSLDKYCEAFEALGYYLSLDLNPFK